MAFTQKQVLMLNKGSGYNTRPWFVLSAKLNSEQHCKRCANMSTCLDFPIVPLHLFVVIFVLFVMCACRKR
jgi:hypothetical protein